MQIIFLLLGLLRHVSCFQGFGLLRLKIQNSELDFLFLLGSRSGSKDFSQFRDRSDRRPRPDLGKKKAVKFRKNKNFPQNWFNVKQLLVTNQIFLIE